MAEIAIRSQATSALFALAQAQKTLKLSAERSSTGLRILSPSDDAVAFFSASELSARATRLLSIKDKITEAAAITGGTVNSLNSIINLVNQLKAKAQSALASTVSTTVVGDVVTTASADITTTLAGAVDGDSFDITYSGTTTTITNNAAETFTSLAAQITAISGLSATVSDGNALTITADDGSDVTITNNVNALATDLGLSTSTNGTNASSTAIETAETAYDVLRTAINTLSGDAGVHGVNLISVNPDSLTVSFNEDGSTAITVAGIVSDTNGLSITAVDSANSFSTQAGITAAIVELDAALVTLQETKASITASDAVFDSRLSFTQSLIGLLDEGAFKLVGADLDAEAALALATQTRLDLTLSGIGLILKDSALTSLLSIGFGAP
ncbi:MAG TPA: hypothetical protein ENI69_08350 [Rhodospirillales bacterium]|nr:hypothetical protein [Rhodospirillales bacterium]